MELTSISRPVKETPLDLARMKRKNLLTSLTRSFLMKNYSMGSQIALKEPHSTPLGKMRSRLTKEAGESPVHNPSVRINKDGTIDLMQSDKAGNPMLDSMGDPICVPGINPTNVAGKTFLLMDEDGDKLRFTVDTHDTADDNEKVTVQKKRKRNS